VKSLAFLLGLVGVVLCMGCGGGINAASEAIVDQVPFADGERLVYTLHDDAGVVIARGSLTTRREGADQFALEQSYEAGSTQSEDAGSDVSTVVVDAQTLSPSALTRTVNGAAEDLHYSATYAEDGRSVTIMHGTDEPRTLELPEHAYDNESSLWLWRTLAFADGYEQEYVSVNSVERTRQVVKVNITGRERVEVPAGAFDTWRLQVRNGRATRVAWVNVEAPHEVVQWDNGVVTFRLEAKR
jgi:hypothetical protein